MCFLPSQDDGITRYKFQSFANAHAETRSSSANLGAAFFPADIDQTILFGVWVIPQFCCRTRHTRSSAVDWLLQRWWPYLPNQSYHPSIFGVVSVQFRNCYVLHFVARPCGATLLYPILWAHASLLALHMWEKSWHYYPRASLFNSGPMRYLLRSILTPSISFEWYWTLQFPPPRNNNAIFHYRAPFCLVAPNSHLVLLVGTAGLPLIHLRYHAEQKEDPVRTAGRFDIVCPVGSFQSRCSWRWWWYRSRYCCCCCPFKNIPILFVLKLLL